MRTLLWILAACGALYVISRIWPTARHLKSTLEAISQQVDSLERAVSDLAIEDKGAAGRRAS